VDGAADRPVVGLLGAFDTGDLGEVALRRVMETELLRRRPDIELVAMAPFGAEHPIPGDEGIPAQPLPPVAGQAGAGLGLNALIITGDALADDRHWAARYRVDAEAMTQRGVATLALGGIRAGAAAAEQVIWFGVAAPDGTEVDVTGLVGRDVWVRDLDTQQRLGGTAVQSGDPLLLAARVFAPETLRRRADLLRMCGALPAGRRLVFEVARGFESSPVHDQLVEALEGAIRADPNLSLIILSLDPTGQSPEAAVEIGGLVAERVHHFPAWAGLDDVAAGIAGAAAVVATSPGGANLAAALGIPVVAAAPEPRAGGRFASEVPLFSTGLPARIAALLAGGAPIDIEESVHTLDGAFAELAERLPRVVGSLASRQPRDPVASALALLQQRLVDERTALQAELSRVQAELDHLRASPEHRIARPIREGYQRWRRRRT
jgi:hypothetical protein